MPLTLQMLCILQLFLIITTIDIVINELEEANGLFGVFLALSRFQIQTAIQDLTNRLQHHQERISMKLSRTNRYILHLLPRRKQLKSDVTE